jgi:hypothetical protein
MSGPNRAALFLTMALALCSSPFITGCGNTDLTDATIRQEWGKDRAPLAGRIAKEGALTGRTEAEVAALLGPPPIRGRGEIGWTNGCSGPKCYKLLPRMEGGRVVSATNSDESG